MGMGVCHPEIMARTQATGLTAAMVAALGIVGMLGPLGTDIYTPALPAMTNDFDVTPAQIRGTMSLFTIGMALGQFFLGSLSDRWGRKPILVGGGLLMMLASLTASFVSDANILIALCGVMGVSAAAGIVCGRAVVADLTHGQAAIRPFTLLGMVVSLGPIAGPVAGALFLAAGGWRAIFVGLAIYALIATVLVLTLVPESLHVDRRHRGGLRQTLNTVGHIVRDRQYISFALIFWFGFGMMFAYISSSTFVIQENLGLPPGAFAASFACNGVGVIFTSYLTSRLTARVRPRRLIRIGLVLQVIAFASLWSLVLTDVTTPWVIFPAFFLIASSMGFVYGPATGMAVEHVRFASGSALAVLGGVQFLAAALASWLVGAVNANPLIALAEVGSGGVILVLVALINGRARKPSATTIPSQN